MTQDEQIEYDLKQDKEFRDLLIAERAALLARVDAIEKFLDMELTKDLRKVAKELRRDNGKAPL